jgi:hypothetical protein
LKIGTIGYRTRTGLGYQVLSYTKHLPIEKVLVVDLSGYNGMPLTDWYQGAQTVKGYPTPRDIERFLEGLDVVLLAETPLNYDLYTMAREGGVKTVCVHNYEFFDHFIHPEYALPDMLISPSMWHYDVIDAFARERRVKHRYIHHPVDRKEFPYRQRATRKPIHIAGKPATHDRNGTWDYLRAVPDGTVITQNEDFAHQLRKRYPRSRILTNIEDPNTMYSFGDFLVFPRRYGGNCLPLNEALSTGMPVLMPDISPNNHLLPKEWLVPATVTDTFSPRTVVEVYSVDPHALRERIEWFKTCDIVAESQKANEIADTISWETLGPKFMEALESICVPSVSVR